MIWHVEVEPYELWGQQIGRYDFSQTLRISLQDCKFGGLIDKPGKGPAANIIMTLCLRKRCHLIGHHRRNYAA